MMQNEGAAGCRMSKFGSHNHQCCVIVIIFKSMYVRLLSNFIFPSTTICTRVDALPLVVEKVKCNFEPTDVPRYKRNKS